MAGGGPLTSEDILKQIDLPTDVNPELTEFSLNYAMQKDNRFDEVGATGIVVWYLNRLEPEWVQSPPEYLHYHAVSYQDNGIDDQEHVVRSNHDELEDRQLADSPQDLITNGLSTPTGVQVLASGNAISHLFPPAMQISRVSFTLSMGITGNVPGG